MNTIGETLETERKRQGLTLRELAARTGVSASLLCSIEKGRVNPSVATLYELATQLGVHPQAFFQAPRDPALDVPNGHVVGIARTELDPRSDEPVRAPAPRAVLSPDERPTLRLTDGVVWQLLTPQPDEDVEFMEVEYPPGGSSGEEMFSHAGKEFGLVLEGELTLEVGFERFVLGPGDSIGYESTTPHRVSNLGDQPMRAVWVNIKRS
jgi:transcriptional regulator with XRE-family HTH domain